MFTLSTRAFENGKIESYESPTWPGELCGHAGPERRRDHQFCWENQAPVSQSPATAKLYEPRTESNYKDNFFFFQQHRCPFHRVHAFRRQPLEHGKDGALSGWSSSAQSHDRVSERTLTRRRCWRSSGSLSPRSNGWTTLQTTHLRGGKYPAFWARSGSLISYVRLWCQNGPRSDSSPRCPSSSVEPATACDWLLTGTWRQDPHLLLSFETRINMCCSSFKQELTRFACLETLKSLWETLLDKLPTMPSSRRYFSDSLSMFHKSDKVIKPIIINAKRHCAKFSVRTIFVFTKIKYFNCDKIGAAADRSRSKEEEAASCRGEQATKCSWWGWWWWWWWWWWCWWWG